MTPSRRAGLLGWLLVAALIWLVAYPLALVLLEGVRNSAGWTLDEVRRFAGRSTEWQALWASLWLSMASVVLAGAIGVPLAFLFERVDFPGRKLLGMLVALPAVLPPLVGVVAFLFLYGETGFIGRFVQYLFALDRPPWRLSGPGAILLVHAYSMYVYFYLFCRAALSRLDGAMLEAASALGAGRGRTLVRVVLPHLRPAIAGAAVLTFMTSLASFSAPYIFGGGYRVMTTQIVFTRLNGDNRMAMVETAALMLLALGALALFRRADPGGSLAGVGKGTAPSLARAGSARARAGIAVAAWALAAVLLLPHLTLLLVSFVPVGTWTTEPWPPEFSPGNYTALFAEPERFRPLFNSLWMATAATTAAMGIALASGSLVVRRRVAAGRLIEGLLGLPWAVPGTVFAIALAALFSISSPLTLRAVLVGTVWILPLAYLVRNLPIASRAVLAGFRQLDASLEEAAASLGAGRWRTLRRVVLPGLAPALAAGATLAFVTSLGDFVTSIMLYTYDTRPISLEILGSLRQGDMGVAAAYGVLLMIASAAVFALGARGEGKS
ncbi:MAG: iron ABC transporter permease [Gemmatimonadales bacterium]|jgi:iron(III) transport system permease protein|nr:MAG: iron ABC transporter permease [Gemmatimonadales bacterium]